MSDPSIIESVWSHYIIIGCSVVGLVWGGVNAMFVSNVLRLSSLWRPNNSTSFLILICFFFHR